MSERISRTIAGVEAVAIMLPFTLVMLFLVPLAGMIGVAQQFPARDQVMLVTLAILVSALVCGWRLMYVFLRFGAARLQRERAWLWIAPFAAALVLVAAPAIDASIASVDPTCVTGALALFGNGGIALVPIMHLGLERFVRANKPLQPIG